MIMQIINSYNLSKFEFILFVIVFEEKLKNEKNEFCMSNDYGSKIDLIASKFFVELDF